MSSAAVCAPGDTSLPPATYIESRGQPIVSDAAAYVLSVQRWQAVGLDIPLFIPSIQIGQSDPNLTNYQVRLTFHAFNPSTGVTSLVTNTATVEWAPQFVDSPPPPSPTTQQYLGDGSKYYWAQSHTHVLNLFNAAIASAFNTTMNAAIAAGVTPLSTIPPQILYGGNGTFQIAYPWQGFGNQAQETWELAFNAPLMQLFSGFPYEPVAGTNAAWCNLVTTNTAISNADIARTGLSYTVVGSGLGQNNQFNIYGASTLLGVVTIPATTYTSISALAAAISTAMATAVSGVAQITATSCTVVENNQLSINITFNTYSNLTVHFDSGTVQRACGTLLGYQQPYYSLVPPSGAAMAEGSPIAVPIAAPSLPYVLVNQEYGTSDVWSPVDSIVFATSMPIENELQAAIARLGADSFQPSTAQGMFPTWTDLALPLSGGAADYLSKFTYYPPGEYRRVSFTSHEPLQAVTWSVFWRCRYNDYVYQCRLQPGGSVSVKLLLERIE